jgi:uncharacterized membrane protein YgaE (UPF0421/DUF939 family)
VTLSLVHSLGLMWVRQRLKGLQLAVRAAVGASLSFAIAQAINLDRPIFACLAAVIVTDISPGETRALGLRRLGAMLLGAVTGAALGAVLPSDAWAVGAGVMVAILLSDMLGARGGARVAGYVCGLIVLDSHTEPWHYGFYRLIETGLGVTVAWLISYVPKLIPIQEPYNE